MSTSPKKYNFGTVTDKDGSNSLVLIYEGLIYEGEEHGYDFNSLIWSKKNSNEDWEPYLTISREDFDTDPQFAKWINEIHSFDPSNGHAILRIAEGDAPRESYEVKYEYSWREWDLLNNKQIELLQVCNDPFEVFDGNGS